MRWTTTKNGICFLVLVLTVGLSVAGWAAQAAADLPAKLGLTAVEAREGVLETLMSGSPYNDAAFRAFKALPPSGRAAVVRSGLAWIKAYVQSAEFKTAYANARAQEKPTPPEGLDSADEMMKKQQAEFAKQVAEMRKNMAGLDAETRKTMEEAIKQMEAQMAAMQKDPDQMAAMRQGVEMQRQADKERYAEQVKVWEENYPADPRLLIRKRIEEFLELSADVNFEAKLVPSGSRMRFADDEYEDKPPDWKVCFRAGKEATMAAREFAQAWLAELAK